MYHPYDVLENQSTPLLSSPLPQSPTKFTFQLHVLFLIATESF